MTGSILVGPFHLGPCSNCDCCWIEGKTLDQNLHPFTSPTGWSSGLSRICSLRFGGCSLTGSKKKNSQSQKRCKPKSCFQFDLLSFITINI